MIEVEIKFVYVAICDSLIRNLNDNFEMISFDFDKSGRVTLKINLFEKSSDNRELELIKDFDAELNVALHIENVGDTIVTIGDSVPLKYIAYQAYNLTQPTQPSH